MLWWENGGLELEALGPSGGFAVDHMSDPDQIHSLSRTSVFPSEKWAEVGQARRSILVYIPQKCSPSCKGNMCKNIHCISSGVELEACWGFLTGGVVGGMCRVINSS